MVSISELGKVVEGKWIVFAFDILQPDSAETQLICNRFTSQIDQNGRSKNEINRNFILFRRKGLTQF